MSFNSFKEMFHQGLASRHLLNEETLFISWFRSVIKEVNDWALKCTHDSSKSINHTYRFSNNKMYLLLDYRILILVSRLQLGTQMYFYVPRLILEIFSLLLLYWILHTLIWNDFEIIITNCIQKAKSGGFSP